MDWLSIVSLVAKVAMGLASEFSPQIKTALQTYAPIVESAVTGLAPAVQEAAKIGVPIVQEAHQALSAITTAAVSAGNAPGALAIQNAQREQVTGGTA